MRAAAAGRAGLSAPNISPSVGTRARDRDRLARLLHRSAAAGADRASRSSNNRDLRVAVARIAEARGQYRIQRADRLPTLDVGGSVTRSRIGVGAHRRGSGAGVGTGVGHGHGTAAPAASPSIATRVNVGVSAFELDFWGRVANLTEAARANYLVDRRRRARVPPVADPRCRDQLSARRANSSSGSSSPRRRSRAAAKGCASPSCGSMRASPRRSTIARRRRC